MKGEIKHIEYKIAVDFLLPRHYSGRKPQVKWAFGWYSEGELKAVCTIGKPASNSLCWGVCGKEYSDRVYELNRLCRIESWEEPLSQFVGAILRILSCKNLIIVSYADRGQNHNGYIYQATNFLYTGFTKSRTDKYTEGNKHSRHYKDQDNSKRKVRTSKHRYIFFATSGQIGKKLNKQFREKLNYKIEPYPKEINQNYLLGSFQKPKIIIK